MRLTNFFQSFNKGILMTAVLSFPLLSRSYIPKIPKKTAPLLTNEHCSFHSSAPLFKKKKQKSPQQFIEKQNKKKKKQLISQNKNFQKITKQAKKEFKKNRNEEKNRKFKTNLTNITIRKLETEDHRPYYLIINNDDRDDAYFCFETAVQCGWNDLVNSYHNIRKVKIKFSEVTKIVDSVEQKGVNFKVYKKVVSLTKIEFDFFKKPEEQKSQKASYKEKIFFEMCKEEARRDKD